MIHTPEASATLPNGITICYDTYGEPSGLPLLLVMGLAGQLIWWPPELCELFAERGFRVIRFDNRDAGRSSRFPGPPVGRLSTISAFFQGHRRTPAYTISDMAGDAIGLLDALGIDRAHVLGASMGGMIVQSMAIEHPERVASMTSVMSTTGRRIVGWQDPRILPLLLRSTDSDRDSFVRGSMLVQRFIGSHGLPVDHDEEAAIAAESFDRGADRDGTTRQMHAVLAQPDREPALRRLRVPSLVVHGLQDRMVHVSGGRATARAIPGAELLLVPGMGHDLPHAVWPLLIDAVTRTATRAPRHTGAT